MRHKARLILAAGAALLSAPALAEPFHLDPGQPVCADIDSLQRLTESALARRPGPNVPCEGAPAGVSAEVLERYPSGAHGMRVVKVRVAAPGHPTVTGYTVEIDRN